MVDVGDLSPAARERVAFLLRNEGVDYDGAQEVIRFPAELRSAVLGAVEEASALSIVTRGVEPTIPPRHCRRTGHREPGRAGSWRAGWTGSSSR